MNANTAVVFATTIAAIAAATRELFAAPNDDLFYKDLSFWEPLRIENDMNLSLWSTTPNCVLIGHKYFLYINFYRTCILNTVKPFLQYQPSWSWKRFTFTRDPSIAPTTFGFPLIVSNPNAFIAYSPHVLGKWIYSSRYNNKTDTTCET